MSKFAPGSTTPSATLTGLTIPMPWPSTAAATSTWPTADGNTVSKFAPGSTTPSATLTGLNGPYALAFDGSGNLYVANWGNGTVSEFDPGGTMLAGPTISGVVVVPRRD